MLLLRKVRRVIRSAVRIFLIEVLASDMFSKTRRRIKRVINLHKLLWMDDRIGALEIQSIKLREQIDLLQSNRSHAGVELPPLRLEANFSARVTIVILAFNHLHLTYRCLNSILENTQYPHYEIILVDNGSIDGTREYLEKLKTERIETLFHAKNLGFVDGCNSGAEIASGDYLLFLNNDTEVQPGWLTPLVRLAERTPDCGAVGSKLIYPNGKLQGAGSIIFSDGSGWDYGRDMDPRDPRFNFVREVDYCSGAAMMVRRDLWKQIGGFDRRFAPAYYEDTDLCFEIRNRGYRVYYQPKSVVIHHEGQTAGTDLQSGYKQFQVANRPKFTEKWTMALQDQYVHRPENVVKASNRRARKSVLVLADSIVGAPDGSISSRVFHILKLLVQMNLHVTLVAIFPTLVEQYHANLEEMGIEVHVGDAAALKALGDKRPGSPTVNYRRLFAEREFDYAIIGFWPIAGYCLSLLRAMSPQTQILLDTVDVDFVSEIPEAELSGSMELRRKALEHRRRGVSICKQADRLWVQSKEDKEAMAGVIRDIPIDIVPIVHEGVQVLKTFRNTSDLLFVGNFLHTPNIDAMQYFCEEVFPLVLDGLEDVKLYIVGPYPTSAVKTLASDRIVVMGNVADLSPYLLHARISVAPLLGSSVKGTIGEALAWGLPVVTTSIGAKGMALTDWEDALIADTAEQFAARVVALYNDEELWSRLSANGRKRAEEQWFPEEVRRRLEVVFQEAEVAKGLLNRSRPRGRTAKGIASVFKRVLAG